MAISDELALPALYYVDTANFGVERDDPTTLENESLVGSATKTELLETLAQNIHYGRIMN